MLRLRTRIAILAAMIVSLAPAAFGDDSLVATTKHFAFHSDFKTNLNDALIVAGTTRSKGRPTLFESGDEKKCFDELPPSARLGWSLAVDFYAEVMSPDGWMGRPQSLIRTDLGHLHPINDERAQRFLGIVNGFLAAATPAYQGCRWEAQDRENRQLVEGLVPRVEIHADAIAPRLAKLYATPWHGLPIRVDIVRHAPPVGANTKVLLPEGGHILIASETDPADALEIVFHEGSHTLCAPWRPDPIPAAIIDVAKKLDMDVPRDLWHVVLFYTTGQVVKAVLEDAGEPEYTPYLYKYEHFWNSSWGRFRGPIETTWPAYMSGKQTLDEAMEKLLRALHDE